MPRADYYDSVGFDDSVYRIHQLFAGNRDAIPTYNIVMVDEYQDFSPLEVGVIEFLESLNRTLIVGDDDQSIYHFRQASPEYLRAKACDPRYQQFPLPIQPAAPRS
ncbi:MAG: UvrD-helicase domain-containing protein [Anaerolineales bacterium]